jgi:hypothetical protein
MFTPAAFPFGLAGKQPGAEQNEPVDAQQSADDAAQVEEAAGLLDLFLGQIGLLVGLLIGHWIAPLDDRFRIGHLAR